MFPQKSITFTDMGRTAFRLIIEELSLQGSEIIFPAFTCDIFIPIFQRYQIKPIFIDVDKETFNIKAGAIEQKITNKTKAIVMSHTYGLACDIEKITKIAKKHNLKIIEDCSHALGGRYKERYLGNFSDAAFFSTYKLFPTLRGGIAILSKEKTISLKKTSFSKRDLLSFLNCFSLFSFIFKTFFAKQAKQNIRKEKTITLSAINRVSYNIFAFYFKNLNATIEKRRDVSIYFQNELKKIGFVTQPQNNNSFNFLSCLYMKNKNRDSFVYSIKKKRIFPTRIWHNPIIVNPKIKEGLTFYPNTIEVSKRIINFPLQSFYRKQDIDKITLSIKKVVQNKKNEI